MCALAGTPNGSHAVPTMWKPRSQRQPAPVESRNPFAGISTGAHSFRDLHEAAAAGPAFA